MADNWDEYLDTDDDGEEEEKKYEATALSKNFEKRAQIQAKQEFELQCARRRTNHRIIKANIREEERHLRNVRKVKEPALTPESVRRYRNTENSMRRCMFIDDEAIEDNEIAPILPCKARQCKIMCNDTTEKFEKTRKKAPDLDVDLCDSDWDSDGDQCKKPCSMAAKRTKFDETRVKEKLTSSDSADTNDSFESDAESVVDTTVPPMTGDQNIKWEMNATCNVNPVQRCSSDSIDTNDSFDSDEKSFALPNQTSSLGKVGTVVQRQHVYQVKMNMKTCDPGFYEHINHHTVGSDYPFCKADSSETDEDINRMLKKPLVVYARKTKGEQQKDLITQGCDSPDSDEDFYRLLNSPKNEPKTETNGRRSFNKNKSK